ncbi:carbohydrate ABC transporter permease [Microbacterium thalli]|uniref:Carbohydrate ABC transporter permease n=1 Tax=Microbacterium thalli TaxID=3027921 RepID=A0ABT5SDU3_9MICO|nr:carbohydrate ABC transporter permease [Microbacterium thalli]MDD7928392.1 carbohydrate ABC transporter permease [Microbacterium thalli]MDD7960973.1 carbohydrate ABC transporter permease [Microbacterium thalli]MDN8549768.1 carbohydrate ABC transporter permease [Microbacterium thalli]
MAISQQTPGVGRPTPELAATVLPETQPAPQRRRRIGTPKTVAGRVTLAAISTGFALLFLYPFAWLLAASFKPRGEVFDNRLIPQTFVPENYVEVWNQLPLLSWMFNSVAIALLAATAVSISSSIVAFGFAYFSFPGRKLLFGLVLATMMLPGAVTMIPVYLIWKETGLLGTWVPLWGANLFGSAFYIFLQRQFFLGLPRELFEAARIDGASAWGLFWRIAMPLSVPSFVIVFLFEFQASWNNLQAALIYLNAGTVDEFTAPLGIAYAMTKYSPTAGGQGDYQYVMVASLLVTLPMLILFAFGQRYFIEGVATQGRKG